jgi:hypothetical protein
MNQRRVGDGRWEAGPEPGDLIPISALPSGQSPQDIRWPGRLTPWCLTARCRQAPVECGPNVDDLAPHRLRFCGREAQHTRLAGPMS